MPHQCIRCKKEYPDGSEALLKGCSCGARFFFFYKERMPQQFAALEQEERKEILKEVEESVLGNEERSFVLDMENIKVLGPGKFEINLVSLFDRNPVVYKHGEGKYVIDIDSTFKMLAKKSN